MTFNNRDTISFEVIEEPNDQYEQQLKDPEAFVYFTPSPTFVSAVMLINGEPTGGTISPSALIRTKTTKDCYTYWDGGLVDNRKYSMFEPITCSCGVSGCAGIWEGIHMKVRKYSVEWRVPVKAGYAGRLDKRFYSFSKRDYFKAVGQLEFLVQQYREQGLDKDQLIFL